MEPLRDVLTSPILLGIWVPAMLVSVGVVVWDLRVVLVYFSVKEGMHSPKMAAER